MFVLVVKQQNFCNFKLKLTLENIYRILKKILMYKFKSSVRNQITDLIFIINNQYKF